MLRKKQDTGIKIFDSIFEALHEERKGITTHALLFGYNPFGNSSQPFVGQLNKFTLNGKDAQYRIYELDKDSIDIDVSKL